VCVLWLRLLFSFFQVFFAEASPFHGFCNQSGSAIACAFSTYKPFIGSRIAVKSSAELIEMSVKVFAGKVVHRKRNAMNAMDNEGGAAYSVVDDIKLGIELDKRATGGDVSPCWRDEDVEACDVAVVILLYASH
jgi:hypothetical protein